MSVLFVVWPLAGAAGAAGAAESWILFAGLILIGGIVVGGLAGGLWGAFRARRT